VRRTECRFVPLLGRITAAGAADVPAANSLQALSIGQHNSAAAMVVATMNFGNDEIVMVVVYSLIRMAILIPLAPELGKRSEKKA
jgi:predicted Na+-dependent transporter